MRSTASFEGRDVEEGVRERSLVRDLVRRVGAMGLKLKKGTIYARRRGR